MFIKHRTGENGHQVSDPRVLPEAVKKLDAVPETNTLPSSFIETQEGLKSMAKVLLSTGAIFLIFTAFLTSLQFATPNLAGNDGYYHIKLAYLMRTTGLKPLFDWLPLTILNARDFVDHHFLYHILLMPFTFGDLRVGAKIASVLFPAFSFTLVWGLLRKRKVPYPALWAAGLLVLSEAFLYRMSMPRAQSLSLAVLVLAVYFLLESKYRWLAPLGFLYVWLYNAFPLLIVVCFLYGVAVWLTERRLAWRPLVYAGLGIGAGLLINPYFPENITFIWQHITPKLGDPTAIRVGSEWYPYDTGQLIKNSGLSLLAFIGGVLALGMQRGRMSLQSAFSLLLAIFFGFLLFQSRRFVEYFPPFSLIFLAITASPLLDFTRRSFAGKPLPPAKFARKGFESRRLSVRAALSHGSTLSSLFNPLAAHAGNPPGGSGGTVGNRAPEGLPVSTPKTSAIGRSGTPWASRLFVAGMVILLGVAGWSNLQDASESMLRTKTFKRYASASTWLAANSEPGARVYQTDWDDFPRLFFYNTHNTYTVGLDPTYLQLADEPLFELWKDISQGRVENPSGVIRSDFSGDYVFTDLKHDDFIKRAEDDPGLVEVYRDEFAVIFQVDGNG